MRTTDCTKYQEDLKAYSDGELPLPRRLQVRSHLEKCTVCQEEVRQMERIARDIRGQESIQNVTLSPELRAKVLARLAEVRPTTAPSVPFWKRNSFFLLGTAGAGLAAATAYFLIYAPLKQSPTGAAAEMARPASAPMAMKAAEPESGAAGNRANDEIVLNGGAAQDPNISLTVAEPTIQAKSDSVPPMPAAPAAGASARSRSLEKASADSILTENAPARSSPAEERRQVAAAAQTPAPLAADGRVKEQDSARRDERKQEGFASGLPGGGIGGGTGVVRPPAPVLRAEAPKAKKTSSVPDDAVPLVLEVDDIQEAEQKLVELARKSGGSLTPEAKTENTGAPYVVSLPAREVAAFRKAVAELGTIRPAAADSVKDNSAKTEATRSSISAQVTRNAKTVRLLLIRKKTP